MATDEKARVVKHRDAGPGYRYMVLNAPDIAAAAVPGQFVHVMVPGLEKSALRRPFSIFDANAETGELCLLYKRVGRGTEALSRVCEGDALTLAGPIGRGFALDEPAKALLVGGGYGVAPLYFLAKRLIAQGRTPDDIILFAGGRTKDDLLALDDFNSLGIDVRIATNDGSAGEKGFVTAPLDAALETLRAAGAKFALFTCGPDGLLKAVTERAVSLGVPGYISCDRHMICGVGACYACIQKTVRGNLRCCVDGPVFKAEELVW